MTITIQCESKLKHIPKNKDIIKWVNTSLILSSRGRRGLFRGGRGDLTSSRLPRPPRFARRPRNDNDGNEITIRLVNKKESAYLNETYRPNKKGPTNVLSFVYSQKPICGDIVLCAPLIPDEKTWQHLVVHGVLHLMGYDHIKNKEAEIMERLEAKILRTLNNGR